MGKVRTSAAVAAVVLAAGMLTACGGGEGGTGSGGNRADGEAGHTATGEPAPALSSKIKAPAGFDGSKGWQQPLAWLPDRPSTNPFDAVPGQDAVALLTEKSGGRYALEVRDAASGRLKFRAKPWKAPTPKDMSAYLDHAVDVPGVTTVEQGGKEYIAVWGHGSSRATSLSKGKEVVSVAVYPASSTGESVSPTHTAELPVLVDHFDQLRVRDGGDGLLVNWTPQLGKDASASMDMATGRVKGYDSELTLAGQCEASGCIPTEVWAVTPKGPVLGDRDGGGFGIVGGWSYADAVPPGAAEEPSIASDAVLRASLKSHLIATWPARSGDAPVWAVHDAATGKVEASVRCEQTDLENAATDEDYPVSLSPSGRYLAVGSLAFDLKTGRGRCYAETDEQREISFYSVGDDGKAYGYAMGADQNADPTPAVLPIDAGDPKALPAGTEVPLLHFREAGMFSPLGSDGTGVLLAFARRSR